MAAVSALLLATATGCYDELDFSHIECDVSDRGGCPSGYVCSAGLCVKGTANTADAALVDLGVAPLYDGPSADDVVVGLDAVAGEAAPRVDIAPFVDMSDTTDAWRTIDSFQDSGSTVDGGGEDLIVAMDAANDVPFTDTPPSDVSPPDSMPGVDTAPDVPAVATEIRTIESFRIPTADVVPTSIIAGPDGNLWFAEHKTKNLGRVSPAGQIQEFPTPSGVDELTAGPDDNIWYSSASGASIGRFNPLTAETTEFPLPEGNLAFWITAGPDGNLWFTDSVNSQIGRMTTNGMLTTYPIDASPRGIVKGMDGGLWYGCDKGIGRIDTDGRDKLFSPVIDGERWSALAITVGGDQRLWVTFEDRPGKVGAMSTSGQASEYRMNLNPSALPYSYSIVAGPDGDVWFTVFSDGLARITPSGVVTIFLMPDELYEADYLTIGPDGYIWFTDEEANRIGRMRI